MLNKIKLNAKQLRGGNHKPFTPHRQELYIILDDVLDTYNVGSIFRLADAVSAKKIYLCGGTDTPPNPRIKKASINTTEWVEWEYFPSTQEAIQNLKSKVKNVKILAIEQNKQSVPYTDFDYIYPIAFVVGNESLGISQKVLDLCDAIVELPMHGVNVSLNVMVSLAIVLYKMLEKADFKDLKNG